MALPQIEILRHLQKMQDVGIVMERVAGDPEATAAAMRLIGPILQAETEYLKDEIELAS